METTDWEAGMMASFGLGMEGLEGYQQPLGINTGIVNL
jgi:hypothetical protein